jgi:hypothetical protein
MANDSLAQGTKSAVFKGPDLKNGKNTLGQTWEDIFGQSSEVPLRKKTKEKGKQ